MDNPHLLTDLFFASVRQHGKRVAVEVPIGQGRPRRSSVTYRELHAMADVVRHKVQAWASPETPVVVLLPRETAWLYAAQIGVMCAGAAHVCLDPAFPDAHVARVVADTGARCVVTDAAHRSRFVDDSVEVVELQVGSTALPSGFSEVAAATAISGDPDARAYVIYTSGTTGEPRGVELAHRGIVNLIREGVERFAVTPQDRVAQNSSPAYDSSVEEVWLALAAGATLVVLDDEAVRSGPDLVTWLRRERITILCPPPTLLRTMQCQSPARELPALRLCYVGGEPLTDDLVEAWGATLRLENGYGPTECTVTVVRGQVRPGEPVTIGTPVPPHVAHVLDGDLQPVAPGQLGELCISGPGLARGYLGQPERTAEQFPTLAEVGRIYRTGDLVRVLEDGRLVYEGRIDAQVKVRGYRIELEAIESVLATSPDVREAVCVAQGQEPDRFLVAHVVCVDELDASALARMVRAELPAYMVPDHFVPLTAVPRTVGGKVDRRALPEADVPAVATSAAISSEAVQGLAPRQVLLREIANALGRSVDELGADPDFFACGGNSLRAALLVSRLRQHPEFESVAVRDLYSAPTVDGLLEQLAARGTARASVGRGTPSRSAPNHSDPSVFAFTLVQSVVLLVGWLVVGTAAWAIAAYAMPWALSNFSLTALLIALPWLAVGVTAVAGTAAFGLAVLAKRVLIGRYSEQRVPAFGAFRLRHWVVCRLAQLVPWSLIEGTELHCCALRALGAKVGKRVHLHRGVDPHGGGWDLLVIGDDVTLGRDVDLGMCELRDGELVMGPVHIGSGATLCTRSGTGASVAIGERAVVQPLSFVPEGAVVAAGSVVDGVPAQVVSGDAWQPPPACKAKWSPWSYTVAIMVTRLLLAPLLAMPVALAACWLMVWVDVGGGDVQSWLVQRGPSSEPRFFWGVVLIAVLAVPYGLLSTAFLLRWLPKVAPGTFSRWSLRYWWLSVRTRWLEAAGTWLSGTLFWPWWLRVAGMRVAKDVEVSTILDVAPEHVALGGHSFLADGVYLAVPQVHQGSVRTACTSLGEGTFVGNHVVIDAGQQLPERLLLGISTVADQARMLAGSSWFGHPAFLLPQREVVEVDRSLTYEPGPLRRANRLFWEALRFALPVLPALLALWWFDLFVAEGWLGALFGTFGYAACLAAVVLASKWLLLGRVRPGQHGLWSCWASRWDFHYVMWQRYGRALLAPLEGTLLLPWYLRAMGMRIGRRCVLGDGFAQVVDPDMITIEDGATVHALFQAHSFEDRVLKIDHVRLGRSCEVGKAAVLLYGADIGERAQVMPHSVVMKHEFLLPGRSYGGAPTAELA